jgi:hypothetical protein
MKITVHKKTLLIIAISFLVTLLFIVFFWYFNIKTGQTNHLSAKEYSLLCESFGCEYLQESSQSVSQIVVIDVQESFLNNVIIDFEIWNSENNKNEKLSLTIKKRFIPSWDELLVDSYPKNLTMTITVSNSSVPLPFWSKLERKLSITKEKIEEVVFYGIEDLYLNGQGNLNIESLKSNLTKSLSYKEDLEETQLIPSNLFLYKDTISLGFEETTHYSQIALAEMREELENKKIEELSIHCKILKKYYPKVECDNPMEDQKTPIITEILSYGDIANNDIEKVVASLIIGNNYYVQEVRNDDNAWIEYSQKKHLVFTRELNVYIRSLLEYLYYSDFSCTEVEGSCTEILDLYKYAKFLATNSEGNLCSNLSFTPLLVAVMDNEIIETDLIHILENYPFKSECTASDGSHGFCSIDLEERVACMQLLSDSLEYYIEDEETEEILRYLTSDTMGIYLENNKERIGLWGKEDINILTFGENAGDLYPVKYYNYRNNYLLYKILNKYYSD